MISKVNLPIRWINGMAALGFILGRVGGVAAGRVLHLSEYHWISTVRFCLYKKDANRAPTMSTSTTPNRWIIAAMAFQRQPLGLILE